MNLKTIRIGQLSVPLVTPFKTALRSVEAVEDIVVMIESDNGLVGFGEAPPTAVITGDTHDAILGAIRLLGSQLLGRPLENFNSLLKIVRHNLVHNSSGKAALEIALYDLFAQYLGMPLYQFLGGGPNVLKTDLTISVDRIDKMVADSRKAVAAGFDALKIKVGKNLDEDLERLQAIHAAVGDGVKLSLDANQGWTVKETLYAVGRIERAGIPLDFIEQPIKAHDLDGLRLITERSSIPILADEAVFSARDAIEILERHAADLINIKLMKTGGLSTALQIAGLAELYHTECMMGCMLESSISVTAAAHLAAARSDVITRIDLDGPALCSENPLTGGIVMNGPKIVLPDAPGLGIAAVKNFQELAELK